MTTTYTYDKTDTLNDEVAPRALDEQIRAANIPGVLLGLTYEDPTITVYYSAPLDPAAESALTVVISAHDGVPLPANPDVVAPTFAEFPGQTHWRGNGNAPYLCPAGAVSVHDFLIPNDVKLYEGTYYVSEEAVVGDFVDFRVIDKDDVLGFGGTPASPYIVTEYIDDLGVVGGERRTMRSGKGTFFPAGLYLRTVYHSTGPQNVHMLVDFLFFDQIT